MEYEKIEKISTGSFDLNKWLYGGYEKGIITMIAGSPGSGKTNMAILAACSQAKKENKVIFIDTEGGFSSDRVKQIVGENYENILKNILLISPANFEEQKKFFTTLNNQLKKEQVSLIVVDGMAMLYRLELGDARKEGDETVRNINGEVAWQMKLLAEISKKQNIPVIITNQVYLGYQSEEDWKKGVERETNIVGGDLFQYWSKCIIELKKEKGRRKAILKKHRSLPEKEMGFEIRNEGIFRKGIF
ncbi:MAG: DNA repair and recombination protein RadB [Candidatus Nanoarchaeia archaeon]|nr:DNA repair and recombination protein RadB [Candidatus Nanoarchaeia archaeon]MDD5357959.1 DNA repair and recombination protein RadB [Candidatus Nanoarchaeia archaeon]MDD5588878.1 DNA repair and recombination protein RadB [Candidatus Nanoarchaeia archaeon]